MGREERRKLEREYIAAGVPKSLAKRLSVASVSDTFADKDIDDGTKVMINYCRLLSMTKDKLPNFCEWVYENRYCIFKSVKTKHDGLYQVTKHDEENPWLFHYSDLIVIGE